MRCQHSRATYPTRAIRRQFSEEREIFIFILFFLARDIFLIKIAKQKRKQVGVRDPPLTFVADVLHERLDTHDYVVLKVVKECWRV